MCAAGTLHRQAVQEGEKRGWLARDTANHAAVMARDRQGAGQSTLRKMAHQSEIERQVGLADPLFIQGQDQRTGARERKVVRVLDALRDTLA